MGARYDVEQGRSKCPGECLLKNNCKYSLIIQNVWQLSSFERSHIAHAHFGNFSRLTTTYQLPSRKKKKKKLNWGLQLPEFRDERILFHGS